MMNEWWLGTMINHTMATCMSIYLGSALLALVTTPLVIRLARRIQAVDRPVARSVHEQPIPRIGGVAIFLSTMGLLVAVFFQSNAVGREFREMRWEVMTLLIAATFIFLIGLVDDLRGLAARFKFLAEVTAAVALCLGGVRISNIALTEHWILPLGGWGVALTLLWVVGITNAVNLSDGLDGLAAGIAAVACGAIAIFALHSNDVLMSAFMLALLGSLSGFLVFNVNPAKVFMGDCGSLFLGFTIAAASVLCVAKSAALVGLTLPALALGIPIFDTLFAMLRRFLERRSLFAPDRRHFHHRLLDLGLRHRHAVMAIHLATLVATGLGLFMMVSKNASSLIVFACVLLLIVLLFTVVGAVRLQETMTALRDRYALSQQQKQEQQIFEDLQLQFRQAHDTARWWQAVCDAAHWMEFARVSLKATYADGHCEDRFWLSPENPPEQSESALLTMPFGNGDPSVSYQLEITIRINGSLEAMGRRASLFGRLIDEHAAVSGGT
jgi:UDP-GlcNAc:undecaprenyl-phosphate GlcNAc-1-phosphate transferase